MISIEAMGLDKAEAEAEYYKAAIAAYSGCHYRGSTRDDGKANALIVRYLADGGREIREFSDKVAAEFGEAWKSEVERRVNRMAPAESVAQARQKARANSAAGWRKAARLVMERLSRRVNTGMDADAQGNDKAADKVDPNYAKSRQAKYGIPEEAVLKASGQLLDDVNPTHVGAIVLDRGTAPR